MLVQSGRPVGVHAHPRVGAAGAHRQLQPGRRLGHLARVPPARAARPHHVRPDDRRLVDLHRHPGHPAGHLRDVRRRRREAVRRHAGRHAHPHRRLRRHGRRPAARRHPERRRLPGRRRRPRPGCSAASSTATSTRSPTTSTTPSRTCCAAEARAAGAGRSAWSATAPRCCPSCCAAASPSTSSPTRPRAHDPLSYLPAGVALDDWARLRGDQARGVHRPGPRVDGRARRGDGRVPGRRRRGVRLRQLDPRRGPAGRLRAGVRLPRLRARLHPAAVLRGQGPVPLGRAVRRPEGHRRHRPRPCSTSSPTTTTCTAGSAPPRSGSRSRACRRGSAGSATASGTRPGCAFNELVADGRGQRADRHRPRPPRLAARSPRPYRETEAMADGSDAIADWPLLNALVNTRVRRDLGVDPPRRRRRHRPLDPRRAGLRGRRHRRSPRRSSRGC